MILVNLEELPELQSTIRKGEEERGEPEKENCGRLDSDQNMKVKMSMINSLKFD